MTEIQSNQPTAIPATEHGMVIVVIERDSYRSPPDLFPWWARLGFGVVVVVALVAIAVLAGPMAAGVCAPVMVVLAGVVFRGAPPETLRDELLEYNLDDLAGLVAVAEGFRRLADRDQIAAPAA